MTYDYNKNKEIRAFDTEKYLLRTTERNFTTQTRKRTTYITFPFLSVNGDK